MAWPTKTTFADGDVLTAAEVNNIGTNLNLFDPTSATVGQVPVADGSGSVAFGTPPAGALKIVTPSAVATAGGTATINTNGSVSLSAADGLSLQGIFSATYDNYLVKMVAIYSAASGNDSFVWQIGGVDQSASPVQQSIRANSTTVTTANALSNWICEPTTTSPTMVDIVIFSPFLSAQTRYYSNSFNRKSTATVLQVWGATGTNASYDGFRLSTGYQITGSITVYGFDI
jgi:hypothetical protein